MRYEATLTEIDGRGAHFPTQARHHVPTCFVEDTLAPAANPDLGAKFKQTLGHGLAEACSAAGHEDTMIFEEPRSKHIWSPLVEDKKEAFGLKPG